MSKTQLIYFDQVRSRGEPSRMILDLAGAPHEQVNIPFAEWPEKKKEMPLGQVPLLVTSEGTLNQSASIARYLGKKHGFMGKTLWCEAENDALVENVNDMVNMMPKIYGWMIFGAEKPENWEEQLETTKKKWIDTLNAMQKHAEKKGGKFCNGSTLQLCDIWLYCALDFSKKAFPDAFSLTKWTAKFVAGFEAEEKVKKYLTSRPENGMGI